MAADTSTSAAPIPTPRRPFYEGDCGETVKLGHPSSAGYWQLVPMEGKPVGKIMDGRRAVRVSYASGECDLEIAAPGGDLIRTYHVRYDVDTESYGLLVGLVPARPALPPVTITVETVKATPEPPPTIELITVVPEPTPVPPTPFPEPTPTPSPQATPAPPPPTIRLATPIPFPTPVPTAAPVLACSYLDYTNAAVALERGDGVEVIRWEVLVDGTDPVKCGEFHPHYIGRSSNSETGRHLIVAEMETPPRSEVTVDPLPPSGDSEK